MANQGVIRPATESDYPALYRICLETANAGKDARNHYSDPEYPGQRFAVPYARFAPDFAFVLEVEGEVMGYVVAAPDTRAFEAQLEHHWWPQLQDKYRDRTASAPYDSKILDSIRQPDRADAQLVAQWPAHLHINLLPPVQQGGWGRKMIAHELAALRQAGVKGVHLGVSLQNEQVCAFYQRMGFSHILRSNAIYMGQLL
ncbi:GNAT family N-acetyltransferase [Pantoea allii]|uniref:Ribosomal protein S18 acetylase RimI-like enzyme n=1 Tax=Pantoea allii TaxID=574096 RepID=A0A2V2BM13_9GAMM|nr:MULTISPECIES: GNAT family N-acetyltransferase [Pantoea]MBW1251174.1 GNAT family N-acetyltransferase [Pantoea allii]MBW1260959.1 GNAT family N-acetyltransferase [Pantoea allii]MBW1282368.1 GNAT family N-acetyltransferase [Pantoea allii]MCH9297235.1 GNAT family N-acetyltransferase [Pantoea allii]MDJ0035976.1 GNAT family N-acetyltransferase [Pantoea allii]